MGNLFCCRSISKKACIQLLILWSFLNVLFLIALLNSRSKRTTKSPPRITVRPSYSATNFSLAWHVEDRYVNDNRKYLWVLVLVNSEAGSDVSYERRIAIRDTWGRHANHEHSNATSWKVIFILGKSGNESRNHDALIEASTHRDVVIASFAERYINLLLKTFIGHQWALEKFNCRYILKTDDDVYIRMPQLINWLLNNYNRHEHGIDNSRYLFYGGQVKYKAKVERDPWHKWALSRRDYSPIYFPPYCLGAFHVLSSDLVFLILNQTTALKPFYIDDAYIGVVAEKLGVVPVEISGFRVRIRMPKYFADYDDCQYLKLLAIGDGLYASHIYSLHEKYKRIMEIRNITTGQQGSEKCHPQVYSSTASRVLSFCTVVTATLTQMFCGRVWAF